MKDVKEGEGLAPPRPPVDTASLDAKDEVIRGLQEQIAGLLSEVATLRADMPTGVDGIDLIELPATVAALVLQACHGPSGHASHIDGHEATLFHRQPGGEKVVRLSIRRDGSHERVWIKPPVTLSLPLTEPVEG